MVQNWTRGGDVVEREEVNRAKEDGTRGAKREEKERDVGKGVESNAAGIGAGTPIRTTSAHYRPTDAVEGRLYRVPSIFVRRSARPIPLSVPLQLVYSGCSSDHVPPPKQRQVGVVGEGRRSPCTVSVFASLPSSIHASRVRSSAQAHFARLYTRTRGRPRTRRHAYTRPESGRGL